MSSAFQSPSLLLFPLRNEGRRIVLISNLLWVLQVVNLVRVLEIFVTLLFAMRTGGVILLLVRDG